MYRTTDFVLLRALEELADSFLNANVLLVVVVDAVVVAVVELGFWLNCFGVRTKHHSSKCDQ